MFRFEEFSTVLSSSLESESSSKNNEVVRIWVPAIIVAPTIVGFAARAVSERDVFLRLASI